MLKTNVIVKGGPSLKAQVRAEARFWIKILAWRHLVVV